MLPLEYPIPNKIRELLIKLVDLSLKYDQCAGDYSSGINGMVFTLYEKIHLNYQDIFEPLFSLEGLGFIKTEKVSEGSYIFFILDEAFKYVEFIRMNKFKRFFVLAFSNILTGLGVIGFIVSTILALIELIKLIPSK